MTQAMPSDVRRLDLSSLPLLSDAGFDGGREGFRRFCATAFAPDGPRYFTTDGEDLVVFRHADLRAMGAMEAVANVPPAVLFPAVYAEGGCPAAGGSQALAAVISNQVFTANPPIHGPIRKLLLNQLGARPTRTLEPAARDTMQAIVAGLHDGEVIDVVGDLAERLTCGFWGALLRLEPAEVDTVRTSVRAMTPMLSLDATPEQLRQVNDAFAVYGEIIERGARRCLATGDHPMVQSMADELSSIDLPDDPAFAGVVPKTVGALLAGNLFDGFHTAAIAAANLLYVLLRHPEARAALDEGLESAGAVIAEALRLEPPVLMLRRRLAADVVYDGVLMPEGLVVQMFWAAGNHDPAVFSQPERFDAARSHQGLTTFGGGLHICPGRFVAGMLCKVTLEALAAAAIRLECADDQEPWLANHLMAQLESLTVRVHRTTEA